VCRNFKFISELLLLSLNQTRNIFLGCTTFLLLIRITFEPQLIGTFVVSSIVDLLCNNADYDKEFIRIHLVTVLITINNQDNYYCCFGGNCLTGTESGVWMLLWSKLENVIQLELNLKHLSLKRVNFFLLGEIHLAIMLITIKNPDIIVAVLEAVVQLELILEALRLFLKKLEDVPILQLNLKHRISSVMGWKLISAGYDKESRHCYRCFEGCYSTGTESREWRLFWKKLEDKELKAVALLELNQKRVNFFFGRNSFRINASYNRETRHYYYCFGGCYSTGTESGALRLFWSKLGDDSLNNNANLGKGPKCFFLFLFTMLQVEILKNSFSISANYVKESSFVCFFCLDLLRYNLDIIIVVLEAIVQLKRNLEHESFSERNWRLLLLLYWSRIRSVDVLLEKTGKCGFTGAESKTCKLFLLEGHYLELMLVTIKNPGMFFCFDLLRYSLDIIIIVLEAVVQLEQNLEHESFSERNWRLTESGEWGFISEELGTVAVLEQNQEHRMITSGLGLKDGNSSVMQCRIIETVSETRMFSRNRLGAVVLLRPNLNMAVSLEQTGSCGLY
uniref:Uncharacterized protein n=1 Tax=Strongyloides stercoralis TaxID=6248 RepID=A0AAF5DPG4_STRER